MKKITFLLTAVAAVFLLSALKQAPDRPDWTMGDDTAVQDVLDKLGDKATPHAAETGLKGVSVERGKALVHEGSYRESGQSSRLQSKHFACIACHNTVKEDPDLSVSNPETRLAYAIKNNLPFLQGTTLYGAVNRTSFYNGDYYKKYGDLVKPTRNNLREAIQLCAVECSQGRRLKRAELESVLAYLWTLELKIGDLDLSDQEKQAIQMAANDNSRLDEAISIVKSKFLDGSPATFVDAPENRKEGYTNEGNAENGKWIYDLSCMHCHAEKRFSFFELDDSKSTFEFLRRHMIKYDRYSTYQVVRYGTSPMNWKRAYMPQYTKEKLSNQQMEDLRAYVESMTRK